MDHIYPTKDYKVYKIKDEVEKLQNAVASTKIPSDFDDIASCVGISETDLKKISLELCSSFEDYGNNEPSETAPSPFSSFPEEALELNCVKTLREGNFVYKEPKSKDKLFNTRTFKGNGTGDLEVYQEAVITIRFYEPFIYIPCMKNQPRFHQEYQVLGSNLLSDLRDRFYCQCNHGPFFDISDNPHDIKPQDPKAPNPGFFFIHDTFYNDTRNPENSDYSSIIRTWFKRFDYIRNFKTATMEVSKFEDLEIRFGYPCVYQHHAACEHIFCITSVDLIDHSNILSSSEYPMLTNSCRKRSTLCDMCGQTDASFIVTNCALHVKDPMKVCENCFMSFHYEKDGITKTCGFNAYRIHSQRPEKSD